MDKHDISEEAKSLFWGAVGECDCNNESARSGMDAVVEFIESVIDERDNVARIMADAADANVKSAAHERIEHAKTTAVLRQILAESGSYLQTKTRDAARERIACTGNCVCLPNAQVDGAKLPSNDLLGGINQSTPGSSRVTE